MRIVDITVEGDLGPRADAQRGLIGEEKLRDAVHAGADALILEDTSANKERAFLGGLRCGHLIADGSGYADPRLRLRLQCRQPKG